MEKETSKKRNGLFTFIILAVILGFLAGITGELVMRYYLSNLAFFRDLYFTDPANIGQRDIVIRDPKKVVVEQNLRIEQLKHEIEPSVVSIYQKRNSSENVLDNVFLPSDFLGQAVVMTSDGWLMTTASVITNINSAVIVAHDKEIYTIEDMVNDPETKMVWLKIDAQNLAVMDFAKISEINDGHQVYVFSSDTNQIDLAIIKDKKNLVVNNAFDLVISSESLDRQILLSDNFSADYLSSPVFNAKSELIGFLYGSGNTINTVIPINYFESIISQVLKSEEIKRPYLGINYLNLTDIDGLLADQRQNQENGALIIADKSGLAIKEKSPLLSELVEGDILLSIEDQQISQSHDLVDLLLEYKTGQQVLLKYLHENETKEINITL